MNNGGRLFSTQITASQLNSTPTEQTRGIPKTSATQLGMTHLKSRVVPDDQTHNAPCLNSKKIDDGNQEFQQNTPQNKGNPPSTEWTGEIPITFATQLGLTHPKSMNVPKDPTHQAPCLNSQKLDEGQQEILQKSTPKKAQNDSTLSPDSTLYYHSHVPLRTTTAASIPSHPQPQQWLKPQHQHLPWKQYTNTPIRPEKAHNDSTISPDAPHVNPDAQPDSTLPQTAASQVPRLPLFSNLLFTLPEIDEFANFLSYVDLQTQYTTDCYTSNITPQSFSDQYLPMFLFHTPASCHHLLTQYIHDILSLIDPNTTSLCLQQYITIFATLDRITRLANAFHDVPYDGLTSKYLHLHMDLAFSDDEFLWPTFQRLTQHTLRKKNRPIHNRKVSVIAYSIYQALRDKTKELLELINQHHLHTPDTETALPHPAPTSYSPITLTQFDYHANEFLQHADHQHIASLYNSITPPTRTSVGHFLCEYIETKPVLTSDLIQVLFSLPPTASHITLKQFSLIILTIQRLLTLQDAFHTPPELNKPQMYYCDLTSSLDRSGLLNDNYLDIVLLHCERELSVSILPDSTMTHDFKEELYDLACLTIIANCKCLLEAPLPDPGNRPNDLPSAALAPAVRTTNHKAAPIGLRTAPTVPPPTTNLAQATPSQPTLPDPGDRPNDLPSAALASAVRTIKPAPSSDTRSTANTTSINIIRTRVPPSVLRDTQYMLLLNRDTTLSIPTPTSPALQVHPPSVQPTPPHKNNVYTLYRTVPISPLCTRNHVHRYTDTCSLIRGQLSPHTKRD